jgi:hypothetical protein
VIFYILREESVSPSRRFIGKTMIHGTNGGNAQVNTRIVEGEGLSGNKDDSSSDHRMYTGTPSEIITLIAGKRATKIESDVRNTGSGSSIRTFISGIIIGFCLESLSQL